jgi:hypothetical protein
VLGRGILHDAPPSFLSVLLGRVPIFTKDAALSAPTLSDDRNYFSPTLVTRFAVR